MEVLNLAEVAAESNTMVSAIKENLKGVNRERRLKEDALFLTFPKPTKYQKQLMCAEYLSKMHPPDELVTLSEFEKRRGNVWETKLADIWRRNKQPKAVLEKELKALVGSAAEADSAAEEVKKELKRQKCEARTNEKALRKKIPHPTEHEKRVVLIAYANERARQGKLFTEEMWEGKEAQIWGPSSV